MKSKRSKACDIPQAVKKKVWERDEERCVVCGNHQAMPSAHFIPRSKGGLGVERNVIVLCMECHRNYDQTDKRPQYKEFIRQYLMSIYPDWEEKELYYASTRK